MGEPHCPVFRPQERRSSGTLVSPVVHCQRVGTYFSHRFMSLYILGKFSRSQQGAPKLSSKLLECKPCLGCYFVDIEEMCSQHVNNYFIYRTTLGSLADSHAIQEHRLTCSFSEAIIVKRPRNSWILFTQPGRSTLGVSQIKHFNSRHVLSSASTLLTTGSMNTVVDLIIYVIPCE